MGCGGSTGDIKKFEHGGERSSGVGEGEDEGEVRSPAKPLSVCNSNCKRSFLERDKNLCKKK